MAVTVRIRVMPTISAAPAAEFPGWLGSRLTDCAQDPVASSALLDLVASTRIVRRSARPPPFSPDGHDVLAHRQAVNLPASPTLVRTQHLPHRGAPTSQDATGPRWFSAACDALREDRRSIARSGFEDRPIDWLGPGLSVYLGPSVARPLDVRECGAGMPL